MQEAFQVGSGLSVSFPVQGSAGDAAAVAAQWQQAEKGTRSSVAVRSAALCALCACGRLDEAATALQELLSLYAAAYGIGGGPLGANQPEGGPPDAAQMPGAQHSTRGDSIDQGRPAVAGGKARKTGAAVEEGVLDSWRDAERAAAQACHQVIHAAERVGNANLAHDIVLAMHKVRPPVQRGN